MPGQAVTPVTSEAIRIARVLCIVSMSYVHLYFFVLPGADFPVLHSFVVETLGRSSVPLLSVISGFLMVDYFARHGWRASIRSRWRGLVVPMIFWNAVAVVLWGAEHPLNDLFALTGPSKLISLAFLRDLFVLAALTPLIVEGARRAPLVLMTAVTIYYLAEFTTPLILRPQIAFYYTIGILIALRPAVPPRWAIPAVLSAFVALSLAEALWPAINQHYFDDVFRRPITAATFWILSVWLARRGLRLRAAAAAAFPFFLVHEVLFEGVGSLFAHLGRTHTVPIYLTIWLATPPVCFLLVMTFWPRLRRWGQAQFA